MELIVGYFGAVAIGVVLGLVGGGGSILTVPIFAYLFHLDAVVATGYSLFVVGVAASVGALRSYYNGMLDIKTGVIFATPALVAVYITRKYIIPAIPDHLFDVGSLEVSKDMAIMVFFALIMLVASYSMIKPNKNYSDEEKELSYNYPLIVIEGIVVGFFTGIVGAGGGFLIIPALVLFAGLSMKKAVGTSLMIISVKSLIGFLGDVQNLNIDWSFLLVFAGLAIVGILLGIFLSNYIQGKKLKTGFGWFVLAMGVYIIAKELIW